ncbi:hypothetical protein ACKWMY_04885 [Serratia sp. J2]|uniref:hypothetical protein n=1 Tax=Serratia sp. J2 TaxID=3386551 RepID=UPI003916ECD4
MNKSLETAITALNSVKNIIDQQTKKLEEQHRKLHKYAAELKKQHSKKSIKPYNQSCLSRGNTKCGSSSISRMLEHAETATTATSKFRLKSVTTSIVEQLRTNKLESD